MNKSILITRPNCDQATRYVYYWAKELISLAKEKGIDVLDLKVERANAKEYVKAMKKNPCLIIFNGGGDMEKVLGFNGEVLVDGDSICLFPRKTTRIVGIKNNTTKSVAYIGHDDSFVFCYSPIKHYDPLDDQLAHFFLDPINCLTRGLLNGLTVEKSISNVNASYKKNIKELKKIKNSEYDFILPYLLWNMKHLKLVGDKKTKL